MEINPFMEFACDNIKNLPDIALELLKKHSTSRVFAFYGNMGVGKTTFIKVICEVLNVKDVSNSPSFGIINEYKTASGSSVYHFDFYRIKNATEFFDLGTEEYIDSGQYCLIEWPEKIEEFLPENTVIVNIREDNKKRIFSF